MALSGQIVWHSLLSKPECSNRQSVPPLKSQNAAIGTTYEQKFKLGYIRSKKRSLVTLSMLNPDIGKEWKKKEVPFTRGCSCYELSRDGEELLIKNAQVITESSMKPIFLALYKILTSAFDYFPEAAERFRKSHQITYQLLVNVYKIVFYPFISPILAWYKKLWSFTVTLLRFTNKLVQFITKSFSK
ncbi:uncharacterized protein [Nicotiana sylvestris]|uniref:Uncharacterized protein n=2 Tax=Nicotiana tabacum TaxID=4097 RepID=A0A1S3YIF5_TOBAC|nr:PREDICTED: uncharacterized protein LOC107776352 [Nicotiana tabacum]